MRPFAARYASCYTHSFAGKRTRMFFLLPGFFITAAFFICLALLNALNTVGPVYKVVPAADVIRLKEIIPGQNVAAFSLGREFVKRSSWFQTVSSLKVPPGRLKLAFPVADEFSKADFSVDFAVSDEVSGPESVYDEHEVDVAPVPMVQVLPEYPLSARVQGIEGRVELEFVVTRRGKVADVKVVNSVPEGIFDQTAVSAALQWRYKSGMKFDRPVRTKVILPLKFELRE